MRILHTSDWHLGKALEGHSLLKEQELFLKELVSLVEEKEVDLVIIAGDVYDTANPPAKAEKLFYDTIKQIADDGKRGVLVIAGNHDNPDRLEAAGPLAYNHGVILLGRPGSKAVTGKFGNVHITDAGEGYIKLKIRDQEAVIATLPYPSEKRFNELFADVDNEKERMISYGQRVGKFFDEVSSQFREDTINLAVSHIYMTGGIESDSERPIQLGGSFSVEVGVLPDAQYIALGHLHKSQVVPGGNKKVRYSGSPIQYSKSEMNNSNCVYIVDMAPGLEPEIEEVFLKNHKPIEVWKCNSIAEALDKCRENSGRDIWVYLEIRTDRGITQDEMKEMKSLVTDIVQITPVFPIEEGEWEEDKEEHSELKIDELFKAYYMSEFGTEIPGELMDLFYEIIREGEDQDETQAAQD